MTLKTRFVQLAAWAGLALVSVGASTAFARVIELDDLDDIVRVSQPRFDAQGARLVVTVSRPDEEENQFENQLVLVDVESGAQRILTHDRPRVSNARWSPDGRSLAFLASDGKGDEAFPQVVLLPMAGGEARVETAAPQGVASFEWHPDGKRLIYLAADEEPEPAEGPERHNRSFVAGQSDYLATETPTPMHLWIEPLSGGDDRSDDEGEAERLVVDDAVLTTGLLGFFTVSPAGDAVAFTSHPEGQPGDNRAIEFYVLDLESGERKSFDNQLADVSAGRFSPDGKSIAYSSAESGRPYYSAHDIFVASSQGGPGRKVTDTIDRTFYGAYWMPSGDALLLGGSDGVRTSLWIQPLDGAPTRLDLGALNPASSYAGPDLDIGPNGELAFVASTSDRAAELYILSSPNGEPRRLTDFNAAVAELDLGPVEKITWETHDGFTADGTLTYPPGYDPEVATPLVLKIHGGPMGASTFAFDTLGQLLAARGWIVFEPNYRGSDNLGDDYQSAVIGDAGAGPGKDVMAGIAAVRAKHSIDADRIAVSGWSYGGYMTSWLIGNYPQAWTAAVAGAPVTDYVDQYNLSDLNTGFGWGFPTSPWSPAGQRFWREQSPIAHLHRAETPTLILCNTGDLRVPITESYKLYHALDDHDVPVEFIAYPIPGHFPRDPVHVKDVYRRWGDWIAKWFDAGGER